MTISLDELVKKAKDVAVAAGKVAGDVVNEVVDTSKTKLAEARLDTQIRELTERLGSIVYEAAKTGRDGIKLQEMLIKELDTLYARLEELRRKDTAVAAEIICTGCGEKNSTSSIYCCKCGAKLADDTVYSVDTDIPESDIPQTDEEPTETVTAEVTEPQDKVTTEQ
ncbi:MAG: hypothetical protein RR276_06545 [Angelakisella sp.]